MSDTKPPQKPCIMLKDRLTPEQFVSRRTVRAIKETDGKIIITIADGSAFEFCADFKLRHDIGLAVQDYFRRTGKDYRRAAR